MFHIYPYKAALTSHFEDVEASPSWQTTLILSTPHGDPAELVKKMEVLLVRTPVNKSH